MMLSHWAAAASPDVATLLKSEALVDLHVQVSQGAVDEASLQGKIPKRHGGLSSSAISRMIQPLPTAGCPRTLVCFGLCAYHSKMIIYSIRLFDIQDVGCAVGLSHPRSLS